MDITISFGWWLLPAIITVAAFTWAGAVSGHRSNGSGWGIDFTPLLLQGAALIVSLCAWFVWALLT